MKINTTFKLLLVLIALAVFLRVYNFSFPAFTTDEARIAFRGYELYHNGVDELGRKLPFLLNKARLNLIPITFTIIFLFLTSKLSWFIVVPFVLNTIFVFRNNLNIRDKFKLSLISFI